MTENEKNVNKKRGERLQAFRKKKNLTQKELGDEFKFAEKYISMLETGARPLDYKKAKKFGEYLNVNPAYLMCDSDISNADSHYDFINPSKTGPDSSLVQVIIELGHRITFRIVTHEDQMKPCIIEKFGFKYADSSIYAIDVPFSQIENFSLSDCSCVYHAEETHESFILGVYVDDAFMKYKAFVFMMNRIKDYISYTASNVQNFLKDYDYIQYYVATGRRPYP